jgi:hypothetical protein
MHIRKLASMLIPAWVFTFGACGTDMPTGAGKSGQAGASGNGAAARNTPDAAGAAGSGAGGGTGPGGGAGGGGMTGGAGNGGSIGGGASGACMCAADVAPVCGANGLTYDNACEAGCAGVVVASQGACTSLKPPTDAGSGDAATDTARGGGGTGGGRPDAGTDASDCRSYGCAGGTCQPCQTPGGEVYVCLPVGAAC